MPAETDAVRAKTGTLFSAATTDLATAASLASDFPDQLAASQAFGEACAGTAPRQLSVGSASDTIRTAERGETPGLFGPRMAHLWVLTSAGRDALVRVLKLLASA